MKVGVIGLGTMGEMLVRVFSQIREQQGITELYICDRNDSKLQFCHRNYHAQKCKDALDCAQKSGVVFLAVKPKDAAQSLSSISPVMRSPRTLVSLVAGLSSSQVGKACTGFKSFVRLMPNTASTIRHGAVGAWFSDSLTAQERGALLGLFQTLGSVFPVENESLMNVMTAIAGSGPAYLYYWMKSVVDAGVGLGLDSLTAKNLTLQTFKGAIAYLEQSGQTHDELITSITTPGGTTEAALKAMNKGKVSDVIRDAVRAAHDRAKELASQ